jgi:hypothetical protein
MNLKNISWFLPLFLAVSCSQTPNIKTAPAASNKVLGTVSLGFGTNAERSSVRISPRVALPDNAITVGIPTFVDFVDPTSNDRYLSATFPITNTTATAFTNLTFYAYNKFGAGIGGTAIRNMSNFSGGPTTSNAQSLLPIHKTEALGLPPVPTVNAATADFQGFNLDEVATLTIGALALNTITATDTILQYGFVARNSTGGRAIAAGGTGTVTMAYKLPNANVNAAYKFVADFVIDNDIGLTRVTRGLGDTTAAADARATALAADEVFLVGDDTDITTNPSQRVTNILTSISPVCLEQALACSLTTTVSTTGTGLGDTITPYSLGVTVTPAAGTALTTLDIDWGDLTPPQSFTPPFAASFSHPYTAIGAYTLDVTVTDSNGDTATDAPTVTVN